MRKMSQSPLRTECSNLSVGGCCVEQRCLTLEVHCRLLLQGKDVLPDLEAVGSSDNPQDSHVPSKSAHPVGQKNSEAELVWTQR